MGFFSKPKSNKNKGQERLIIITGCAGSGKTTIGKRIAEDLGYAYIDKDTVTREYTDFILTQLGSSEGERESVLYREKILPIEYSVTFKLCRELLETGSNVVLTIPFISQIKDYNAWNKIKLDSRIKDSTIVKFVWIKHDINAEKANLQKRDAVRDSYKLNNWSEYADSINGLEPSPEYNAYIYVNDCDINLSITLEEIKKWIEK